jgi:porin
MKVMLRLPTVIEAGAVVALTMALATPATVLGAETGTTNSTPDDLLLLDSLGRLVKVPTNEVPAALQPPAEMGLARQIPNPAAGAIMPPEVRQRVGAGNNEFQFFPATPPPLGAYLASQDDFGNTAILPDPLFFFVPLEGLVQGGKYRLSEQGFRYSWQQSVTFVNLAGTQQGESDLEYYSFDFKAKWNIYNAPANGNAGWISSEVQDKNGFNAASRTQDAQSNLGTVTDPTGIVSDENGLKLPELAWQQSLRQGEIVLVAGMVSQRNYIDGNAYADGGRGKFINSALIHSQVLPLAQYNFGANLQWQPVDEWYAMAGGSMGASQAGNAPWTDYGSENWSMPLETGYAPANLLDWGPGIYRLQPFVAGAHGTTGGGLGFDLQQQLGVDSPVGWFGRYGFGDAKVTGGAAEQAGTGFVFKGPFDHVLLQRKSNDFLGVGFVWSEPDYTAKTVSHENEYGVETVYALQLTPTIKIQPDLQMIWNPAFNQNHDQAVVFQLQLDVGW